MVSAARAFAFQLLEYMLERSSKSRTKERLALVELAADLQNGRTRLLMILDWQCGLESGRIKACPKPISVPRFVTRGLAEER